MKKKRLILTLVISLILCSVNCLAVGNTISEQEAKELILSANDFYFQYQGYMFSRLFNEKGEMITTKAAVSEEARRIYTEDIADDMWKYQCWLSPEHYEDNTNDKYCFTENTDGTITITSYLPQNYRVYYISGDYAADTVGARADSTDCIRLCNLTGTSERALALVTVYKAEPEMSGSLVWMTVEFGNTSDGWRISGGNLIYAFSSWLNPSFEYEPYTKGRAFVFREYAEELISFAVPEKSIAFAVQTPGHDTYYNIYGKDGLYFMNSEEYNEKGKNLLTFTFRRLISADENRVVYTFDNILDGKTYDAVFSYDQNSEKSGWRLTGGGVYDIVNGKTDVAPYTGDEANTTLLIAVAVSVISLLGMGVAIKARKTD